MSVPLLECRRLEKRFEVKGQSAFVLRGISLEVAVGSAVGLVGESGAGKSTLSRCLLRLLEPSRGAILFEGEPITDLSPRQLRPLRRKMQMVTQDSVAALDPKLTVTQCVTEPLAVLGRACGRAQAEALLEQVHLEPTLASRYPHQLSAGQRQRVCIARALALEPSLLIADEPLSALDPTIQAQIANLLLTLQRERELSLLFVSHDLQMVLHLCEQVAVLYAGRLVELCGAEQFIERATHPYSRLLLHAAGLGTDSPRPSLEGSVSPLRIKPGCAFAPRCSLFASKQGAACKTDDPQLVVLGDGHQVACHEHR